MSKNGISRREFMAGAAAAGLVMGASALCPGGLHAAEPKTGGHLKIGINSGETTNTLDPSFWGETFMVTLGFAIHGGLAAIGADGKIAPEVAESWEAAKGGQEWIFNLRRGITFSSGQSLTSANVIDSLNLHRAPNSKSGGKALFEAVTDIKADGPDRVIVSLSAPIVDFPYLMTDHHIQILPSRSGAADWKSGVGAGPYILEEFQPGVRALLKRNPNSYRQGYLDSAELINIPDAAARQAALLSGSADVINRIDLKTADLLGRRKGISVEDARAKLHYWMVLDTEVAPFDNPQVREALKYALNRQEMLDVILNGHGVVGNDQPITAAYPYHDPGLKAKAYDPEKARAILKAAGHENLEFTITVSDTVFSGAVDMCVLYQKQAEKAGIKVNINRLAPDGYLASINASPPAAYMTWWAGRASENTMLTAGFSASSPWNRSHWKNAEFNELLAAARQELDEKKRRGYYYTLQRIVSEDSGVMIPVFANTVCAYNSDKAAHGRYVSGEWDLDGGRIVERWFLA